MTNSLGGETAIARRVVCPGVPRLVVMRIELDMRGRIKDAFGCDPFLIFPEKALDRYRSCFGRSYGERKFHFGAVALFNAELDEGST
jgi:hypothetical protein